MRLNLSFKTATPIRLRNWPRIYRHAVPFPHIDVPMLSPDNNLNLKMYFTFEFVKPI